MTEWPLFGAHRASGQGFLTASTQGTSMTAGAANVKGTPAAIVTSCPFDVSMVTVMLSDKSSSSADYLVDLMVGAAASEVVVIPNMYIGGSTARIHTFVFPCRIRSGERISVRCQCPTAAATLRCHLILHAQSFLGGELGGRVVDIGTDTSLTKGTRVYGGTTVAGTPNAANAKQAWAQVTASCPIDSELIQVCPGDRAIITRTSASKLAMDIGIGAAGSEQVVIPDVMFFFSTSELRNAPLLLPCAIRAGERIAVRGASSVTTNQDIDAMLHLVG